MTRSCVLCDSWERCPANPKGTGQKRIAMSLEDYSIEVESALLLGFAWGSVAPKKLCDEHREMLAELLRRLRAHPDMAELEGAKTTARWNLRRWLLGR